MSSEDPPALTKGSGRPLVGISPSTTLMGTGAETVCNPEPGDQRMWSEFRQKALESGMMPVPPDKP